MTLILDLEKSSEVFTHLNGFYEYKTKPWHYHHHVSQTYFGSVTDFLWPALYMNQIKRKHLVVKAT